MDSMNSDFDLGWRPPIALRKLAGDDESFVGELIQIFQDDTAMRLQELGVALSCNDRTKVRAEAHRIRGSAIQMGLEHAAALCQTIELSAEETLVAETVNQLAAALRDASSAMSLYWKTSEGKCCKRANMRTLARWSD